MTASLLNKAKSPFIVFGGQKIFKRDGKALNEAGTFAGSLTFLDDSIRKFIENTIFLSLLEYTSLNVAKNLSFLDIGYVESGKTADIVIWNPQKSWEIHTTIINGKIIFRR